MPQTYDHDTWISGYPVALPHFPPVSDTISVRVGRRLRELRNARGLTQVAVAERAGYGAKYLNEIEAGKRPDLPLSTMQKIVEDGLGASMADVFADFPKGRRAVKEREPLPANVEGLARAIADLPAARRREVVATVRAAVRITG